MLHVYYFCGPDKSMKKIQGFVYRPINLRAIPEINGKGMAMYFDLGGTVQRNFNLGGRGST